MYFGRVQIKIACVKQAIAGKSGWVVTYPINFATELVNNKAGDSATATKLTLYSIINKTVNDSNFYTQQKSVAELKIKVEGLTENLVLGIGSGNYSVIPHKITQNGTYTINNLNPTWAIKLYDLTADSGTVTNPVTVTLLSNSSGPTITVEQVSAARAKGWTLYVNGSAL